MEVENLLLILRHRKKRKRLMQQLRRQKRKRRRITDDRTQQIILVTTSVMLLANRNYFLSPAAPIVPDLRFNVDHCGTEATDGLQAEALFRFSIQQLKELVVALRIPEIMRTEERDCYHAIEGLCIVLRRNAYPIRYMDMVHMFGRQTCSLSRIYRHMLFWFHTRWQHLSTFEPARVINYLCLLCNLPLIHIFCFTYTKVKALLKEMGTRSRRCRTPHV